MAVRQMTADEFIAFMKRQQGDQADKDFAQAIGVTPQYLCDIYKGRRAPGNSLTEALGVTRKTVYVINRKEGQDNE
jgi:hypothetical protein